MYIINKAAIDLILKKLNDFTPVTNHNFSQCDYFLPGNFRLENICINFDREKISNSVYFNEYTGATSFIGSASLKAINSLSGMDIRSCFHTAELMRVDPSFNSKSSWNDQFRLIFFDRWQASEQQRLESINRLLDLSKCDRIDANCFCDDLSRMIRQNYTTTRSPMFLFGIYGKISEPQNFGIKIYFATKHLRSSFDNSSSHTVTSWRNGESLIKEFCAESGIESTYLLKINSEIIKFCPENRMSFWGLNLFPAKNKEIKIYYLLPNTPQQNYFPLLSRLLHHSHINNLKNILSFFKEQHFCLRYIAISGNSKNSFIKTYFFPTIHSSVAR